MADEKRNMEIEFISCPMRSFNWSYLARMNSRDFNRLFETVFPAIQGNRAEKIRQLKEEWNFLTASLLWNSEWERNMFKNPGTIKVIGRYHELKTLAHLAGLVVEDNEEKGIPEDYSDVEEEKGIPEDDSDVEEEKEIPEDDSDVEVELLLESLKGLNFEELLEYLAPELKRENLNSWAREASKKFHPDMFINADEKEKKKNEEICKFFNNAWNTYKQQ